jgi:hypothetical protein
MNILPPIYIEHLPILYSLTLDHFSSSHLLLSYIFFTYVHKFCLSNITKSSLTTGLTRGGT